MNSNEANTHVTTAMLALGAIIFVSQGWLKDFKGWVENRVKSTALPSNDASILGLTPLTQFLTQHAADVAAGRYKLPLTTNSSGQIVDATGAPVQ